MQTEIINKTLSLKNIEDYAKSFKAYDFSDYTAEELEVLHHSLEMLQNQAQETDYAILCLRDMVGDVCNDKRREEEAEDYASESKHRSDLHSWWNSQRM